MPIRTIDTASGDISSDSLCTPPGIFERVADLFGGTIDGDPCSNEHSLVPATQSYTFGGLHLPWWRRTYENHPYSTNEPWANKAVYEMKIGRVSELVVLCMTATSTAWWSKFMHKPRRNPRVICTKRIKFLGPDGRPLRHTARFDTSLIYYGSKPAKFDKLFHAITVWSAWGR